ncbi:hypothetical protein Pmar_PMAR008709 [Perkinsus marinus ATCC 50983]|uniref:Uncharacterized protein n=1 Tax=Perkinsus marinus (strain ATCC 50983 / TXsc) TaxID=423536 RepID=C5L0S8_PERM5|nr:hypothetical protein Pmar_PMAR008709 [Perkinsus marinus ATCC 50983]EER09570.1 hypothetical protein Pmar_PMAR008709 [Perkinsus marinus ATCC 50983]|eukprot:XP_002777775.1 hypothetical protein Pmar_PMAR008709 [Perkinsus marinus ATCC 50983]
MRMATGQAMGSLTYRVANAPTVDNLLFHLSNEPMDRLLMPKVINAALGRVAKLATISHRGENGSIVFDKVMSIMLKGLKCREWDNRNLAGAFWAVAKFHSETTETPLSPERVVELFEAMTPYVKHDTCSAVDVSNILWALGTFKLAMNHEFRYSSLVEDLAASLCTAWSRVLVSSEPGTRAVSTTAWGAITVLADHRGAEGLKLMKATLSHAIPRLQDFKPPEIAMLLHMVVRCSDAQNLPEYIEKEPEGRIGPAHIVDICWSVSIRSHVLPEPILGDLVSLAAAIAQGCGTVRDITIGRLSEVLARSTVYRDYGTYPARDQLYWDNEWVARFTTIERLCKPCKCSCFGRFPRRALDTMMVLDARVCVSCLQKLSEKKASGLHYTGALIPSMWGSAQGGIQFMIYEPTK